MQEELNLLFLKIHQLIVVAGDLRQENLEYRKLLSELENVNFELERSNSQLKNFNAELTNNISELSNAKSQLSKDNADLQFINNQLKDKFDVAKAKIDNLLNHLPPDIFTEN